MAKYFKGITNISLTLELQYYLQIKEKYQCLRVFCSLMINLEGQIQKCQLMPFKKPCLDQYFKQQRSLWELFPSFFQRYETKKALFCIVYFLQNNYQGCICNIKGALYHHGHSTVYGIFSLILQPENL